jgi:hypothetical protein
MRGKMADVTVAREAHLGALERLRGSVRVTLRARQWLNRWRATSPTQWHIDQETVMIANAIELSTLTEFVAIHRDHEDGVDDSGAHQSDTEDPAHSADG